MKRYTITIDGESADIGTTGELLAALDVLQGHYDREALSQLKDHLPDIITNSTELERTFAVLHPDDRLFLVQSFGKDLAKVCAPAGGLRDILALLGENRVEIAMMETLGGEGLRSIIGTSEELAEVLQWVYGDCNKLVLDLMGADYLKELFENGYQVSLVFNSVDNETQLALAEMIGWDHLVSLVNDRRDLAYLFRAMPDELSERLLKEYDKESLWKIVRNQRGWEYVSRFLSAEETKQVAAKLEVSHAS